MKIRPKLGYILLVFLAISFLFTIFVAISLNPNSFSDCNNVKIVAKPLEDNDDIPGQSHKLAVIVPFRDRFEELLIFVPFIHKFLKNQRIRHKIFVTNQVDQHRFNRGSLINIGHLLSRNECDYLVMHDVDLLPLNSDLSYSYPENGPFHVAAPHLHPKYHYSTFVGGILLLTREHFEQVNGLSNKYWGWGLEDDEFYARMKDVKLRVTRPQNISTNQDNTFKHIHNRSIRKRDTARLYNQKEATRRRDRVTGLDSVKYKLESWNQLVIDGAPVTIYNLKLTCDYALTPWCDHKLPSKTLR